jgi:putative ABC transport system permease protein
MRFSMTLSSAARNLMMHKFRSFLAILGVIFGVASVICMLSVSAIAKREAIQQIQQLGVNNIILNSRKPEAITRREQEQARRAWTARYGIKRKELELIKQTIPGLQMVAPFRFVKKAIWVRDRKADVTIAATDHFYPRVLNHGVQRGRFLRPLDQKRLAQVCVLGSEAKRKLFPYGDPIGQKIKIGRLYFETIGVMQPKGLKTSGAIQIENPDNMVFIPYWTAIKKFGKRQVRRGEGVYEATEVEIDRAILKVGSVELVAPVARAITNIFQRDHDQDDYEVIQPYELLRQYKRAQWIFMIVMTSIAAISLIVGGIGIMNIMLANVAERRREIGVRRAVGATRRQILSLFLTESIILCIGGGVFGIVLGGILAYLIGFLAGWQVTINPISIVLGIAVAGVVGIGFGTLPARRASRLDPVIALREE